jgi:hypothetical protein
VQTQQKRSAGRPPIFSTPEEMQKAVDYYFDTTQSPVVTKTGVEYVPGPYTMTGLALALGFNSRQTLYEYEENPVFSDTVLRARARVVAYAEGRLYDRDGAQGAKFALSNYKDGWVERSEQVVTGTVIHQLDAASLIAAEDRLLTARRARLSAGENAITVESEPV